MKEYQELNLLEEITRNDGSKYFELSNILHNGRSELAAERGMIQSVRILKLNIPHSTSVDKLEQFINEHYEMPTEDFDHWEEWQKTPEMEEILTQILKDNRVG